MSFSSTSPGAIFPSERGLIEETSAIPILPTNGLTVSLGTGQRYFSLLLCISVVCRLGRQDSG